MSACGQEMCPNWSGDGNVCPCAIFDLTPPCQHGNDPADCWFCDDDTTNPTTQEDL